MEDLFGAVKEQNAFGARSFFAGKIDGSFKFAMSRSQQTTQG